MPHEPDSERSESDPRATAFGAFLDSVVPALYPTDAALARALSVPQSSVLRWRRGTVPSVPNLLKLAQVTNTSTDFLLRVAGYTGGDS